MTDNTYQSLEYLDVLYPGEKHAIVSAVADVDDDSGDLHYLRKKWVYFIYKLNSIPKGIQVYFKKYIRSLI